MVPRVAAFVDANILIYMTIISSSSEKSTPLIGQRSSLSSEICVDGDGGWFKARKCK